MDIQITGSDWGVSARVISSTLKYLNTWILKYKAHFSAKIARIEILWPWSQKQGRDFALLWMCLLLRHFYLLGIILRYQVRFALIRKQPKRYLFLCVLGHWATEFPWCELWLSAHGHSAITWAPVYSSKAVLDLWWDYTSNHRPRVS